MERLSSVAIVYRGGLANEHVLEGQELGHSLVGASRTYALISHAIITGKIPHKRTELVVSCRIKAPREGSLATDLIVVTQAALMAGALPLAKDAAKIAYEWLVAKISEALSARWAGRDKVVEQTLKIIEKQMDNDQQVKLLLVNGLLKDKVNEHDALLAAIDKLAIVTRAPAREMLEPVGRSCTTTDHTVAERKELLITYDSDTADAVRATGETLGRTREYEARIAAIDTINKTGKFDIAGFSHPMKGLIADPELQMPENVYTHALDTQTLVTIKAKPALNRDGTIKELHIIDAEFRR